MGECDEAKLSLEFVIDTLTKRSILIGNNGFAEVQSHEGSDGVTFLELLDTGAVQTTTISGVGFSVHSRHTMIAYEIVNSQYLGSCRIIS